jgi:hypothetical protein
MAWALEFERSAERDRDIDDGTVRIVVVRVGNRREVYR